MNFYFYFFFLTLPLLLFRHSPTLPQIMRENWMPLLKYCSRSVALQSPVVIFSLHLFHATSTFSTSGWVIKSVPPQLAFFSGSTLWYRTAIIIHGRSRHLRHFPSKKGKTAQCAEFIIVFTVFLSQTFRTVICLHTAAMLS